MDARYSIQGNYKNHSIVERMAQVIFIVCGLFAVLAVGSITIYMILSGTPALFEVGIKDILFSSVWKPTGATPQFGILYVILTSILGTVFAILICVPSG
ncbi:MAG: phosphate ABC transporter permease subunit PstC, partial [Acetivibrio sp.]